MEKLTAIGRVFIGLALIGLGVEHFIFQDFLVGRAPAWPASIPRKLIWAYFSGFIFVGIGIAIIIQKKARTAAIVAGILIFTWALLRHIPPLFESSFLSGAWTRAGKALVLFSGSFALAGTLPKIKTKKDNNM